MIEDLTEKGTVCYRVVHPNGNTIEVSYPGQTEFVVHCKQMTFAEQPGSHDAYVAKIEYYDTTNSKKPKLLMTDTLSVTKDFVYTVPMQFSQMRSVGEGTNEHEVMYTYSLSGNQDSAALSGNGALALDAEAPYGMEDKSDDHTKYFQVNYTANNPEKEACVTYTVRFINAAEHSAENGKILGTDTVPVTKEQGSFQYTNQPAEITVGDVTYVPYGKEFTLKYSTQASPVYDIYYVPKGYTPHDSYDVTVNYVNVANNEVLQTGKVHIDPTVSGETVIGPAPEKLEVNGVNYLRLDGQSQPFLHTYFTPARTYTVYYRDSRDQQYGNTVIRRTVVRTVDNDEDGTGGTGANGDGATTPAWATLSENGGELSSVDNGTGDGALLNNEGVDTATERELNDDSTPLAQSASKNQAGLLAQPAVLAGGVIALLALAVGLYFFLRKRGNRKNTEAQS